MLTIEEIKKLLPHRYPLLMIDRVLEVVAGQSCKALKNVTGNELFFEGHFPGNPIMPGILVVESLAQTAGIVIVSQSDKIKEALMVFFGGIEKARFRRQVVPGDQLLLEAVLEAHKRNLWIFKGTATVEGQVAAEAEVKLVELQKEETQNPRGNT